MKKEDTPVRVESEEMTAVRGAVEDVTTASIGIEDVTTAEGLAALRPTWEALFAEAETASPFNSWPWVWTWWEVFGRDKELHVLVARDGDRAGRALAIAPFYALTWRLGPLRLRALVPLGYGNDLTERQEMLVAAGRRAEGVRRLAAYIDRERGRLWDVVIWNDILPAELPPSLRRLISVEKGWAMSYEGRRLPGTWTELVGGLHPRMRANLRYYPRRLARRGYAAEVSFAATPCEVARALPTFLHLHRARAAWIGGRRHVDRFGLAQHRRFLRRVAPGLAARGMLRVALLRVEGKAVAAQLTLEHRGTLSLYYSGVDPTWMRYSVGLLLTAACLRDAIERGLGALDWLRGTGQWKQRWGTATTTGGRVTLVRDAPHVLAARAAYLRLLSVVHSEMGRSVIPVQHGRTPEHRVLRWLATALRQPTIG